MEVKKDDQKYQAWFEDIALPIQKIRKFGNSYGIIIPKPLVDKYDLKEKKVIPVLIQRKKRIFTELKDGEEWVKLGIRERSILEGALKKSEYFIDD